MNWKILAGIAIAAGVTAAVAFTLIMQSVIGSIG